MAKAKKPKHIAVAGNIGAGKTTLTEMLSKHYKWIPNFEDVDHNPYLMDFYEDMPRWSFNLQIFFLNSRLRQLVEIQKGTETVIQDRTIYEDANIFAPNLHEMGLMSKRDFDNYFHFFQTLKTLVQPPDLLIYLNASVPTLVGQIQKRGREYEENDRRRQGRFTPGQHGQRQADVAGVVEQHWRHQRLWLHPDQPGNWPGEQATGRQHEKTAQRQLPR